MTDENVCEGGFCFGFTGSVDRLDEPGRRQPVGLSLVDFVVEQRERFLLIEVKDPSDPGIPPEHRARQQKKFQQKLRSDELIARSLVPKARDSYLFLHLMKRDTKPFVYVVLLGLSACGVEPALLVAFKDRLLGRLRREADRPWERRYVRDCIVLTEASWSSAFPDYRLSRASAAPRGRRES